ncbi:putative transporter svop-1 Synaptic vesicle 2-related protein [Biomphalaria pfeifferi]|uniref:Transporter svop-1 Synaptic vesicle 2-related protein n=1 Tax=Biomphalaria pfeifferi TaxID=112525 RepID=A0AAD8BQH4_BIOPF|nr:putative transporter svop-1 Synaptic vesicle 2-related protein [Biomphalaria pfeifferi]
MSQRNGLSLAHSGPHKSYHSVDSETSLLQGHAKEASRSIKPYSVQTALDALGFGIFQIKISALAGLCYMTDAMELMLMSILAPILKCSFQLTSVQEALLTTSVFVGMCITANFWGIIADKYGRKPVLLMFAALSGYFGILCSLSPNFWWILGLRFIVGCGLGATPQSMTYYSEFLPTKSRGTCLMAIAVMWAVGASLQAALALVVMPTLGWRWLLGLSSIPLFLFILTFKVLPESPRYYLFRGYHSEAEKVLAKISKENGRSLPEGILQSSSEQESVDGATWNALFRSEYLRITLLATIMSVSGNTAYYGSSILTTSLFENDDSCHGYTDGGGTTGGETCEAFCQTLSTSDYVDFMITSFSELPGVFISMFLMKCCGRKSVQTAMYFSFTVAILLCNICLPRGGLVALLFIARALGNAAAQGGYLYIAELFPTSLRAKGLGWCSGVSRVGIIAAPFIAQVLIKESANWSISCFGLLGLLGGLATMLMPIETANREMK